MRVFLLHPDSDFEVEWSLPDQADDLVADLGLEPLLNAMAAGDALLLQVARRALVASLCDPEEIRYRQGILRDAIDHPDLVRRIHELARQAVEAEKKIWGFFFKSPDIILHRSVEVMETFIGFLRGLRQLADEHGSEFRSEGMTRFVTMVKGELDDAYFTTLEQQLRRLHFRRGVLVSARLGTALKGTDYVLRGGVEEPQGWMDRLLGPRDHGLSFEIPPRDEAGGQALGVLRGRGVAMVAEALGHSADHILSFFVQLRAETGFYVACLNLRDWLTRKGEPTCIPECRDVTDPVLRARGLYDASLTLLRHERVVGNDIAAEVARLVVITGANQGGKSTFLRSVGQAYLMSQCGMFAAAEELTLGISTGLHTHFAREEDASMESGRLDEELSRLSRIADRIRPGSVLLCNESFASTNEWEGSEIGRQVIGALLQADVRVFLVTHLYNLAGSYRNDGPEHAVLLRAERRPDGARTFRILPGDPLPTSHGRDLYEQIFAEEGGAVARPPELRR